MVSISRFTRATLPQNNDDRIEKYREVHGSSCQRLQSYHSKQKNAPTPTSSQPEFWLDKDGLHFSTDPGHSTNIRRLLSDFSSKDSEDEQRNFLLALPRSRRNQMLSWLATHMPQNGTIQRIFQQLSVQIAELQTVESHSNQHIFRSYDATSPQEQAKRQERREKAENNFWLKVPWRREEMQVLGLHTLLNAPEVQSLYPISSENGKVKVSYKLSLPIGVLIQNYGKVSKDPDLIQDTPPQVPKSISCTCQQYKTEHSVDFQGHVATTDPGFIQNERLRSLWLKGRKYRCQAHPQTLMEGFTSGLDNFITTAAKRNRQDSAVFDAWRTKILQVLMTKCDTLFAQENSPSHNFLSKDGDNELQRIHKDMVVTYADKSSHDFVLCCKHVYKRALWEEIHSKHYETEPRKSDDIWAEHSELSDMMGKPAVNAHRYLYGILKMHKTPTGIRWIAGNQLQDIGEHAKKIPACSLSTTEMMLGGVLRMGMHNLEAKDKRCRKEGIKRYWVVTNVDRVAADIKYHVNSLRGQPVFTRDFTRMYTSIPQAELVKAVEVAIREVFEWHSDKTKIPMDQLRVKVSDSRTKPGHTSATFADKGYKFSDVLSALKAVCTEVYFQQREDGPVLRQKQGLPMGGKASAELANLYCYVKESQFIDSLIAAGKTSEAKKKGFILGDISTT